MASVEIFDVALAVLIAVLIAGVCRNRGWSSAIPLMAAGIAIGLAPIGPEGLAHPEFVLVVVLAPLVFGEGLTSSVSTCAKWADRSWRWPSDWSCSAQSSWDSSPSSLFPVSG